ncbi:unannotated protein [freshwater metagenome]|uniref:Unannotated protein n=1 Tax=freshwater metagenome TaxID=449393 RepID=A0A6J7M479_9ZZZZ
MGATEPKIPIIFNPTALTKPKPAKDACFAAPARSFAACLLDLILITSSVKVTVTETASGSLNNLVNLFRLARSFNFKFGADSVISALAFLIADSAS